MSGDAEAMKPLLAAVAGGRALAAEEAAAAFEIIMSGDATAAQIGAFLMALRVRGETVEEIAAAAQVMRDKALRIDAPAGAVDTVGTGGDASGTYNVSTGSAFVVAAAGVPVANTATARCRPTGRRCADRPRHQHRLRHGRVQAACGRSAFVF